MKINCNIIDDLLPLYIDGACSEESRTLLEEHLESCPACKEKLRRMQSKEFEPQAQTEMTPQVVEYAKKVKRHRVRIGALTAVCVVMAALILALLTLTVIDMRHQASPIVYEVEDSVFNLTSTELNTTTTAAGQYILFTNTTQIGVTVHSESSQAGAITLWNADSDSGFIQIYEVDGDAASCTFSNLSSANRYRIVCEGFDDATVTITDARTISFWGSFKSVLSEVFGAIMNF